MKRGQIFRYFKEQEALESSKRQKKLERNHREAILKEIDEKNKRIEKIRKDKENALIERQKLEILLKKEKEKALQQSNFSSSMKGEVKMKNKSFNNEEGSNNANNSSLNKNDSTKTIKKEPPQTSVVNNYIENEKNKNLSDSAILKEILLPSKKKKTKKSKNEFSDLVNEKYLKEIEGVKKESRKKLSELLLTSSNANANEDIQKIGNEMLDAIKFYF